MTSTGLFLILAFDLAPQDGSLFSSVTSVTAQCLRCQHVTTADIDAARSLPGGVILFCPSCGARQGVANAGLGNQPKKT